MIYIRRGPKSMLKQILNLIRILPFFFLIGNAVGDVSWKLIKEKEGVKVFENKKVIGEDIVEELKIIKTTEGRSTSNTIDKINSHKK